MLKFKVMFGDPLVNPTPYFRDIDQQVFSKKLYAQKTDSDDYNVG